jgi:hypothetical protein
VSEPKYAYPMVECRIHPGPQPGMIICLHVIRHQRQVCSLKRPTEEDLGMAVCRECLDRLTREPGQFLEDGNPTKLICYEHFREWEKGIN